MKKFASWVRTVSKESCSSALCCDSATIAVRDRQRAEIILLRADGMTQQQIAAGQYSPVDATKLRMYEAQPQIVGR